MLEKQCFKCLRVKPLEDFYKHERMPDGHLNKCKFCAKNDVRQHRAENLEKIREYDVSNALRDGKLAKPDICSLCGCDCDRIEGHHHDYAQPLNVTWVCKPCHWLLDQERRVAEA